MGGKSGGGGHTPFEAPDSLKSAQRLRAIGLISLGPIKGAVTEDEYQSVYFDHTPLKNAQGEWNYLNTEIQYNLGTQDQQPLPGFEASEREVPVNAEVKKEHSISRTIIDPDITRLRVTIGVGALFQQQENGDTGESSVQFEVLINNERYNTYTIAGKSSSRFFRSYIIEKLPPRPFTLTVRRITEDSKSQRLQNSTHWASYTEIIDTKLSYPNMAMVGIKTDSRYNPNFPNINFLLYGRLVKIPANYDPITRSYADGIWQGDWKLDWTNNPAWVFYDLVTNKLAGLGQRLGDYGIDKFQLYQIAQYCDQLVPDGYGGQEPRMTANLWITEQRDAYSVISDMASVFRAIVAWNGMQLTAIQDRPADPICRYTQANVIAGKFNRQYVPLKSIYTAVEVEYVDEKNQYQKAIEYVSDDALIRRYGYNVKKIVAFACTSRGQARRYGKWVLETSRLEQCTLTFSVGREGIQTLPGDIIEIADKAYANLNLGGRVLAVDGNKVTLDSPVELSGESYLCYTHEQHIVRHLIMQVEGTVVTLKNVPQDLSPMAVWTLQTPLLSTELYRVLSVAENDDGSYSITALQHEPQKEAIVDNGVVFEPRSSSLHQAPKIEYLDVNVSAGNTKVNWQSGNGQGIVTYDIKILKNGNLYDLRQGLTTTELDLSDLPDGDYQLIIRSRNTSGQIIDEKSKTFTIDRPPVPTNVQVTGGLTDVILSWSVVDEATQTEIWASEHNDLNTAKRVAKVTAHIYTHTVGARQVRFYWLRHTRGQNVGEWHQTQGVRAETGANIDAELEVLNEKLKAPLAREVIETALPARNLELVKTVPNLAVPTQKQGANLLYNQADGKLYRWNGSRYTAEVSSADLGGVVPRSKLDDALLTELGNATRDLSRLNSLSIGGYNYLRNSDFSDGLEKWHWWERQDSCEREIVKRDNQSWLRMRATAGAMFRGVMQDVNTFKPNTDYTVSFDYIGSGSIGLLIHQRWDGSNEPQLVYTAVAENRVKRAVFTFRSADNPRKSQFGLMFGNLDGSAFDVQITRLKFEQGSIATDWTPSPEDSQSAITEMAAEITAYKQTQAEKERVQAVEKNELSAKLRGMEGSITATSNAVANLNGTVSTLHTIKAQTIANGRTAIAGIAFGATERESSVIVMADKFAVVKNAQDGNPTSLFTVHQNQVAINGNLVANGSITGDKLNVNSAKAAILTAGAIRAEHLAAGGISADKLAIGLGGNLLYNPIFANNGDGWTRWESGITAPQGGLLIGRDTGIWNGNEYLPTENQYRWQPIITMQERMASFGGIYQDVNVVKDRWYIFSGFIGAHRAEVQAEIEPLEGLIIGNVSKTHARNTAVVSYHNGLADAQRIWVKFKALSNGIARCLFNLYVHANEQGPFTVVRRPMLEECTEYATEPSPWQNAGVTSIHGGSIVTRSITAEQIGVGQITTEHMVAGSIDAKVLKADTVTAGRVVSGISISSPIIDGGTVRAGKFEGGSININNRFKVNTQGQVEMRSASHNVGLVINNDQILVYDQNGRIRVKMGKLT